MTASSEALSQKGTLSSLLAGRVGRRPQHGQHLQEATVQLLEQQQDLCSLLRETGNPDLCKIFRTQSEVQKQAQTLCATAGPLLECELRRRASQLGVPVAVLAVKMVLERLMEITETENENGKGDGKTWLLTSCQRVQLCLLLESSKDLLSHGAFCPKLLWQEYKRNQRLPKLEVVYHLHFCKILALDFILESDEKVESWLVSQLKALCGWTPPQGDEETKRVQQKVLLTVVGVLVGKGFELSHESAAARRRTSLLCSSVLDDLLLWHLDSVENNDTQQTAGGGDRLWLQVFDASLCGASVSTEALRRFFMHTLTQTLTYNPRLTVSDAITLQNEWTFAKASRLITSLFRKLVVIFSVEELLCHLQQVLETHEVNWKHVLCFLSTLLVYNPCAPAGLRELLSRLLSSAFEGYDLENMITAFLLARQGALEGPVIFPSYSDWFKMCFGGGSGYHAASKKSLVFLLKFLSDLVPFEPPQYLKVHVLHPPYVAMKHRSLLMDYISLAKTRLADLKESLEDMGLYEDVSGAGGAPIQCQAVQDVEKAVSLFESTGRISATVMEASIFRRPYFLTRFLPALLTPRALPVKPDARMSFIEALTKADKIPAAQYSSYVEACQKQRQQGVSAVRLDANDNPADVLTSQLQEFAELLVRGNDRGRPDTDEEPSAQLSRISHTLGVIFPGCSEAPIGQSVIKLHTNVTPSPELHVKVINMILRTFCQCALDTSKVNPPNKQSLWASMFVGVLVGNTQLLSILLHRLWDLLHNQGSSLSSAHLLGLAAFMVHLHASMSRGPLVQLVQPTLSEPVPVGQVLSSALDCSTHTNMLFCMRLCVAAVCYGMCRGDSLPQRQQQDYIPSSLYKKLLYLIPRLLPEARRTPVTAGSPQGPKEDPSGLWSSVTDTDHSWRNTVWHLWRHAAFSQLEHTPLYQLSFSEWLVNELRVQRSQDILSDAHRQVYQQWACMEHYLTRPEERGGCGGDMKNLCSQLLSAIMDQHPSDQSLDMQDPRGSQTGTCLPDILSRVQELVYEMEAQNRVDLHGFLFDFVSMKCSSESCESQSVSRQLGLQRTLSTWNRVMLALPATLFVQIKTEGRTTTLDCTKLIEHVNQHQRKACSPAGLLSCHLTAHMLRGVLCASVRCQCSAEEVNKSWRQISVRCPLLLLSTVCWWEHLSPVLSSLWHRMIDGQPLPEQLQLLADCQKWACSLEKGPSPAPPAAAALQLAASLHRTWRGGGYDSHRFNAAVNTLRAEMGVHHRQVLVFLLFLCVSNHLSALLYPQEEVHQGLRTLCTDLLSVLVDSRDWLLIFKPNESSVYQSITMVTSDESTQLMPWAFYSLLLQQRAELLHRAVRCPEFLHTAVLCYVRLLQLGLEGHTLTPPCDGQLAEPQMERSEVLSRAKQFVLGVISQTSPGALSSSQLRQLESCCTDLDPEVAGALSVHHDPRSLSPEMDFC